MRTALSLVSTLLAAPLLPAQIDDNFDDNTPGPQWSLVTDAPAQLALTETNNRLEATSAPSTNPLNDALYLSRFHLATTTDFEIAIDYTFTAATAQNIIGSALTLVFGVGRDADGTDAAAVGFGYQTISFFGAPLSAAGAGGAHRTDDVQTEVLLGFAPDTGTFVVSYDAAADSLTLGDGTLSYTLDNVVRAPAPAGWNAASLFVSFGVRGSGFTVGAGDATFDNFTVRAGHVLATPYDFWALERGLPQGPGGAPADDPDLDGLTNLDEFALGTDPLTPDAPAITTALDTAFAISVPHRATLALAGDATAAPTLTGDGIELTFSNAAALPLTVVPGPPGLPALPPGYIYTTLTLPPLTTAPAARVSLTITPTP